MRKKVRKILCKKVCKKVHKILCNKLLILLVILFLMLLGALWLTLETERMEQECLELQEHLQQLKAENTALQARLEELRELNAITMDKMQDFLDVWQVDDFEATFYSPGDDRNGLNSSGDSEVTALGYTPGLGCYAVDFDVIPPHALMWVEGEGWGIAGDTGRAIRGKRIDIYRRSYDLAMRGGRQGRRVMWRGR